MNWPGPTHWASSAWCSRGQAPGECRRGACTIPTPLSDNLALVVGRGEKNDRLFTGPQRVTTNSHRVSRENIEHISHFITSRGLRQHTLANQHSPHKLNCCSYPSCKNSSRRSFTSRAVAPYPERSGQACFAYGERRMLCSR
jgi:hypothetical protein